MITTILIVLVAVVVLIVIIAVLALHFLRADDSGNFDEATEEPRRTRRQSAGPVRELAPAQAERGRPRRPEPAREQWAAEDRVPSGYREAAPRPPAPERRTGQTGGQRPVAASAARPAKPARPTDQDPKTGSWDSLSDVDYWAELAADKPQITPVAAASGPASPVRRSADSKADPRQAATAIRPVPRGEPGPLPTRQRSSSSRAAAAAGRPVDGGQTEQMDIRAARQTGAYPAEPATQSLAALARLGGQPPEPSQRPPSGHRPGPPPAQRPPSLQRPAGGMRPGTGQRSAQPPLLPPAQISPPNGHGRPPMPMDDDPLTSPSFPAINASDSRSYRTRRPGSPPSGPHTSPQPAGGRASGGFSEPARQFPQYPDRPAGYSTQPGPALPPAPAAAAHSPAPVANPYGSYVSAPQPGYPDAPASHLDAGSYGGDYAARQQADGSWYDHHGAGAPGNGYAAADYPGAGYQGAGYPGAGYPGAGYPGAAYQGGQAGPGGYGPQGQFAAGQYDQRGYGTPDLAHGQDGYQGYPGYGAGSR